MAKKVSEVLQKFIDDGGYLFGQDVDPSGFGGMSHECEGISDPNHHIITMGVRENCAAHAAFGMVFATQGRTPVIVEAQFSDFAALMTDATWNCNALCKTYGVVPNVTLMTFRGPEEGSAEHSKSCIDIFGEMPGVIYMNGGFWGNQEECAKRLELCLASPGVKVIEFNLVEDDGKKEIIEDEDYCSEEQVDMMLAKAKEAYEYSRRRAETSLGKVETKTPEECFSDEVLTMLDMLGFDKNNPESIKMYDDAAKRVISQMKETFKKKDKAYNHLICRSSMDIITFELLRKCSRIMQVVLKGQKDENPESLEENLMDIAVTATALATKLRTGMMEDKVFEEMQKYFEEN